jgi:hypothetical protein
MNTNGCAKVAVALLALTGPAAAQSRYFPGTQNGSGSASTTLVQPYGGSVSNQLATILGRQLSVADFGAKCDGVTDDAAAFNRATLYASTHPMTLTVPAGTCLLGSAVTVYTATGIVGQGIGVTILQLKAGANSNVLESNGFASLTGVGTSGGVNSVLIADMTLDGASSTNTAPAATAGHGLALYGRKFDVRSIYVQNAYRSCFWTEYATAGPGISPYDGHVRRITADGCGERGWWNGVSDLHADDVNIRNPSQNSDGGFAAIKTTVALHASNINVWSSRGFGSPPYHGYGLHLGGSGSTIANVHLETAKTALLYLDGNYNNVTGLYAYNPCCAGAVGVLVGGTGNQVSGVAHTQSGSTATVGVQLGTSQRRTPRATSSRSTSASGATARTISPTTTG